jgi:hypothetical protein
MCAIGPDHVFLIDETNIRLVDQRSGLKRVAGAFTAHVTAGEPVQFVVDEWIQLIERRLIPLAPLGEQLGDFMLLR